MARRRNGIKDSVLEQLSHECSVQVLILKSLALIVS